MCWCSGLERVTVDGLLAPVEFTNADECGVLAAGAADLVFKFGEAATTQVGVSITVGEIRSTCLDASPVVWWWRMP